MSEADGDVGAGGIAQGKIDALAEQVEEFKHRFQAHRTKIDLLEEELEAEREAREELEAELEERDRRLDDLRQQVARVDRRTDMLEFVEHADEATGRQRSVALLLHLKREAEAGAGLDTASVDREAAERALHRPDVDRTTIYDDMRRAARLVDNEAVCAYTDGTLRLDLEQGELPDELLGQRRSEVSR